MSLLVLPRDQPEPAPAARWLSFALAMLLLSGGLALAFSALQYDWNWAAAWRYRHKFVEGWLATLAIAAASLALSLVLGLVSALASKARFLPLRYLFSLYVELTRGTPLLVQILLYFYIVADAAGLQNRYLVGVLIMALFSGAYLSEIFRAGLESVGKSQLDSAKAIGLTQYQTFRYVVFPQALRRSLPALAGQFANLVKDSSLLSIIAISEFTLNAQEVNAVTYSAFESFFPLAAGYLVITLPVMRLSRRIERRLRFET